MTVEIVLSSQQAGCWGIFHAPPPRGGLMGGVHTTRIGPVRFETLQPTWGPNYMVFTHRNEALGVAVNMDSMRVLGRE